MRGRGVGREVGGEGNEGERGRERGGRVGEGNGMERGGEG